LRDSTMEAERWPKVCVGGRIGEIVRRHVDGLDRGHRAPVAVDCRCVPPVRPVPCPASADIPARLTAAGPCRPETSDAGLDEAKDVVDQHQHVLRRRSSRKYSAMVKAAWPTRNRARRGGSFIWPNTMTVLSSTPASLHLAVEFFRLAAAFADAAEQADPVMTDRPCCGSSP
jgi:hypothetical protein